MEGSTRERKAQRLELENIWFLNYLQKFLKEPIPCVELIMARKFDLFEKEFSVDEKFISSIYLFCINYKVQATATKDP